MKNKAKKTVRIVVIAITAVLLFSLMLSFIELVAEWMDERNQGQDVKGYDYCLHDKEYRRLRERLDSYHPDGEEFQVYWDVADAYQCFATCDFWAEANESEALSVEEREAAKEHRRTNEERLRQIYARSGETAKRYIEDFAGDFIR